jgi:photosystem II stability/assembly factor-like uncharacterized protein
VRTVRKRLGRAVLLAVPAVVLIACGGGSSPESGLELSPLDTSATTNATTTIPTSAPPVTTAVGPATSSGAPTTVAPPMKWTEATFNLAGLASDCGNVAVDARPGQDMMIAFVNTHGLYSTPAAGSEWTPIGTGGDPVDNRMTQILADPTNPQTFWESGSYGTHGVFRTDDNGATFQALGNVEHVDYMSIDFTDPQRSTILAGGHESSTLHRSKDGGETWDEVPGLPADVGFAASPYVIDANTFLVGSYNGPGSGVYRSTDAGTTWEKVFDGPVLGPVIDTAGKLRWLRQNGKGVITSTDGGVTWTSKSGGGVLSLQAVELVGLPDGSIASWTAQRVVVSNDDGVTWRGQGPALPYEPKGLAYSNTGTLFAYTWTCDFNTDNAVDPSTILRLDPA